MASTTVHFLLVYSFKDGALVEQDEFTDAAKATAAYSELERKYAHTDQYEIVLVGSDSIETVMKTHGHYFNRASNIPADVDFERILAELKAAADAAPRTGEFGLATA